MPKIRSWWGLEEKTRERKMMDNYGKRERNEDLKKKKKSGKHRGESEWTSRQRKKEQED